MNGFRVETIATPCESRHMAAKTLTDVAAQGTAVLRRASSGVGSSRGTY